MYLQDLVTDYVIRLLGACYTIGAAIGPATSPLLFGTWFALQLHYYLRPRPSKAELAGR